MLMLLLVMVGVMVVLLLLRRRLLLLSSLLFLYGTRRPARYSVLAAHSLERRHTHAQTLRRLLEIVYE